MSKENKNLNEAENSALNIADVSSRYITLKRDDLIEWKKDIPIQEVTITDFKSTSVTRDKILRAYYILFSDGNTHKVLKDRHQFLFFREGKFNL